MSRTIEHECFSNQGELTTDIMKDHIVPSLGIGATDTIKKSGWNGQNPAFVVGLTIGPTGEHIRSAKAFGVGFHDNNWTISTTKLWGGKPGFKIAINLKDQTMLSFPGNTLYTNYIDCEDLSWYAYNTEGSKAKLNRSEYAENDIKKFFVRASAQLIDEKTARVTYAIVPVSLDELKREYLEHFNKAGFPNIMFQRKDIPFVPLAEDDWELPSSVIPLLLDERSGDTEELPEAVEVWLKFSQFLRSATSPTLVKDYQEWVAELSANPTYEALPAECIWPLPSDSTPRQSGSGEDHSLNCLSLNSLQSLRV